MQYHILAMGGLVGRGFPIGHEIAIGHKKISVAVVRNCNYADSVRVGSCPMTQVCQLSISVCSKNLELENFRIVDNLNFNQFFGNRLFNSQFSPSICRRSNRPRRSYKGSSADYFCNLLFALHSQQLQAGIKLLLRNADISLTDIIFLPIGQDILQECNRNRVGRHTL